MEATQNTATMTVIRSRFFSATDDPPRLLLIPPPNMSDRPPPLPLCNRTSAMSSRLLTTSRIYRTMVTTLSS